MADLKAVGRNLNHSVRMSRTGHGLKPRRAAGRGTPTANDGRSSTTSRTGQSWRSLPTRRSGPNDHFAETRWLTRRSRETKFIFFTVCVTTQILRTWVASPLLDTSRTPTDRVSSPLI